jgi:SAM-dependent methyltransferase
MMNTVPRFSERAHSYDRFRWDYVDEAVKTVIAECGLSRNAIVADIGSGTGMLARHFVGRVGVVLAVEPSAEMRAIAARQIRGGVRHITGLADNTTLPDHHVDMIGIGRALHWFPAAATRKEFHRIVKPGGWMAVFSIPCTNEKLLESLRGVRTEENGWAVAADKMRMESVPLSFYFGHEGFRKLSFPASVIETWDEFVGRVSSFSPAPTENHPLRPRFEKALRDVFEQYAVGGVLHVSIATEITFGQIRTDVKEDI